LPFFSAYHVSPEAVPSDSLMAEKRMPPERIIETVARANARQHLFKGGQMGKGRRERPKVKSPKSPKDL
jgi:hypothetical protein